MSTVLLTQITRTGTYPAQIPLDVTYNRGFISFVTNNWTAQMFYELPAIKLDLYTDVEGTMVRSPLFSRTIKTYNPTFPLDQQCSICISMKDVPTNCYLFVTPIFDNNAIEARNELIRNGIEDGQLWTTKTNTFNILLSYEDNDSVPTNTITQQPPISFTSDGTSLFSWSMLGNGEQTGTPTPDNPIMPTFCGVRTGNLFDKSQTTGITSGTYINQSGELSSSTYYYLSYPIQLTIGATYTWSFGSDTVKHSAPTVGFYDSEDHLLSVARHSSNIYHFSFTVPQGCAYVRASVYKRDAVYTFDPMLISGTVEQADSVPLTWYEPYGWAEKITCAGQTTPVYLGEVPTVRRVKKLVFTGTEALQTSGSGNARFFYMTIADARSWATIISDRYVNANIQSTTEEIGVAMSGNSQFRIRPDTTSTVEEYKQYLASEYAAGHPVTVWYILTEPETAIVNEPLAKIGDYADELHSSDTTVTIPTIKGQNTLTVEGTLQPSSMTITGNIK